MEMMMMMNKWKILLMRRRRDSYYKGWKLNPNSIPTNYGVGQAGNVRK